MKFAIEGLINLFCYGFGKLTIIFKMGNIKNKQHIANEDLIYLMSYTGHSEEIVKKWCTSFKKDCLDGRIAARAFVSICQMFFPFINTKHFCNYIFKTFEAAGNGFIAIKELMQLIGDTTVHDRSVDITSDDKIKWSIITHEMWIVLATLTKIF